MTWDLSHLTPHLRSKSPDCKLKTTYDLQPPVSEMFSASSSYYNPDSETPNLKGKVAVVTGGKCVVDMLDGYGKVVRFGYELTFLLLVLGGRLAQRWYRIRGEARSSLTCTRQVS